MAENGLGERGLLPKTLRRLNELSQQKEKTGNTGSTVIARQTEDGYDEVVISGRTGTKVERVMPDADDLQTGPDPDF